MDAASVPRVGRACASWLALVACLISLPALGREPAAPGLHDLVVYSPGTHQRDLPAVRFEPSRIGEGFDVEIPPAVHVHRYYYSGDREIQGPIIQGGPTVVVARHPKTGEQMHVEVMLPAGAPRIAYNKSGITYVYPDQRVCLHFSKLPLCSARVVVKHHSGQGIGRSLGQFHESVTARVRQSCTESSLARSAKETATEAGELARGARESAASLAGQMLDGAKSAVGSLPGVANLRSLAEESPHRKYLSSIQEAARRAERTGPEFLRTNR